MDFIIADADRMEIGYLPKEAELDMDLSREADNREGCNDAELKIDSAIEEVGYGAYLFCPGTEYGGRFLDLKRDTASVTSVWYLDTWRRMLGQTIIEPLDGEAYRMVNGDANAVIAGLLQGRYGGIFVAPEKSSGIMISGQFDRYVTLLDGLNKILEAYGGRLNIQAIQGGTGEAFYIQVEAVPITNYGEEIEYSQDNQINLTIRDCRRGINHLICLGSGELTERMVRHLYIQEDGGIGTKKYYTGLEERTEVFDYPNAEDESELLEFGKKRLQEVAGYKKLEMSVRDLDVNIGDIVAGRDRVTGTYMAKPIVNKVLKMANGKETITYKVKGDD